MPAVMSQEEHHNSWADRLRSTLGQAELTSLAQPSGLLGRFLAGPKKSLEPLVVGMGARKASTGERKH